MRRNEIDVFWNSTDEFDFNSEFWYFSPEHLDLELSNIFIKTKYHNKNLIDYFNSHEYKNSVKNTFVIKAHKDISIKKQKNKFLVGSLNTKGETKNDLTVVDGNTPYLILNWFYLFFSDQNIDIEILPAYYHKNKFLDNIKLLPKRFNISKWFERNYPCFLMDSENADIKRGDALCYVKFHTDKKVNLINFETNKKIDNILKDCKYSKETSGLLFDLYKLFKEKRYDLRLLKEIKNNLTGY